MYNDKMMEKKMSIALYGWLFMLVLVCFSCAKELDINLNPPPSKLVVKGTLSPQRGLVVQVFHTLNPYDWFYRDSMEHFVENAEIHIFHHDTLLDETIYLGGSFYQSQSPEKILSGKEYSIVIEVDGYDPVRVDDILIPEAPPEVMDFQVAPYDDQPRFSKIENLLTFSILNKKEYTVFNMKVTYDDNPKLVLGFHLFRDGNVICEDFDDSFSNKCYDVNWINRKYQFTWYYENRYEGYHYPIPQEWIYFHIGIIDPVILEYEAADDGRDQTAQGFTEPILAKGNVEDGLGYVVGENIVTIPYKVP